ncbi:hypothetical protein RQY88_001061 [Vibrio vulnificus]|uniref:ABC-three component system middle component 2 n=1 Tax=Vibrio TaxID=662 RepID=UPI000735D6BE|nr:MULTISPECIES: ABC-three component system middle component 2 [Vibrio]EJO2017439.1 hypothetical protein [Vibrio vulnificus]EKF9248133.1 hypothetical protein [Vibrio cholerae]EKF9477082.1 hypothetical protein [Vibrio cholerae]EKY3317864.1 hypothetical protein [Vibrio cholerae]ELH9599811.1 hypothetical protein [Vibrio vulnificus]
MEILANFSNESVFNTELEAGVRAICVLNEIYPKAIDIDIILKSDYMIVYSSDFNGPESIHQHIPNRKFALDVRYQVVKNGLELMKNFDMVEVVPTSNGLAYRATESVSPYLRLMTSPYSKKLIHNASWVSNLINSEEILNW